MEGNPLQEIIDRLERIELALVKSTSQKVEPIAVHPERFTINSLCEYLKSLGFPVYKSLIYKATMNKRIIYSRLGREIVIEYKDAMNWVNSALVSKNETPEIFSNISRSATKKLNKVS